AISVHLKSPQLVCVHSQDSQKTTSIQPRLNIQTCLPPLKPGGTFFSLFLECAPLPYLPLLEAQKALKQWKPWPEDRERISDLQDLLVEQEHLIRSLMEDKKYYELELANREVNYNKIFNANPKVGIVNPLQKKGDCKNGGAYFINVPKSNSLPIGRRGRLLPPLSGTMQHNQRFSLCDRIFSMTPPSKTKKQLRY
uniref:Uncharacterized protein n=1 Tax=Eptatretus burgeri TaxID=7764 RepID=A0A8C4NEL7_EPTBU